MAELVCRYCKKPLDQHVFQLVGRVPMAGTHTDDGTRLIWCTKRYGDEQRLRERIDSLTTLVRSLRWRASWVSYRKIDPTEYLEEWANKVVAEIERQQRRFARWF